MNKKAQGISINVVIVAAIALLVLVILSVIFMGRMGTFSDKSKDCEAQSGKCLTQCGSVGFENYAIPYTAWSCAQTGTSCCIKGG